MNLQINSKPNDFENIIIYRGDVPDELKKVIEYEVKQGYRAKEYGHNSVQLPPTGTQIAEWERRAHEDSESEELREQTFKKALEAIVLKAEKDKESLGVIAIGKPRIIDSTSKVREDGDIYQGALTLLVQADGYTKK